MNRASITRARRRSVAALLASVAFASMVPSVWAVSPYASELIAQNGAYGPAPYDDPNAVLGEPTRIASNNDPLIGSGVFHTNLVEAAYNVDLAGNKVITTMGRTSDGAGGFNYGSITVKFDHPIVDDPTNPYGIDLNVYGNAFYAGSGFASDTSDMRSDNLVGGISAEPVVISVSQDNVNWYTYANGPYGDTAFPTQGYAWSGSQFDSTGNGWTNQQTDFTKPVNPTLSTVLGVTGHTMAASDAIDTYVGSGGGTGIDLAASGFASVQYVRVASTAQFRNGEIDGFADVRAVHVGEALSITPSNVASHTPLYFQDSTDATHTDVRADFTLVSDLAKLSTGNVTDAAALAGLAGKHVLASYQLTVSALVGSGDVSFAANYELSPGVGYSGNGAGMQLIAWDGLSWQSVPFAYDTATGLATLANWTNPMAALAFVGQATLAGDFNGDGVVDSADYVVWRNGLGGQYTASDYQVWRANFGQRLCGKAAMASSSVPEPQSWWIAMSAAFGWAYWHGRRFGSARSI